MSRSSSPFFDAGKSSKNQLPDAQQKLKTVESLLLRAVDFGLLGVLFAVPFLTAGHIVVGDFVLAVVASWTAIFWALFRLRQPGLKWHWTGAEILLLGGVALGLFQITLLPPEFLNQISPRIREILPLWNSSSSTLFSLGPWSRLSLTPTETLAGIATFVAYGLIFIVAAQRIARIQDVERLLRWIAISVVAMAVFGILQYVMSNGKFFWVFEHPLTTTQTTPKGSFFNRNHFAQFLALGIGPLIWVTLKFLDAKRQAASKAFAFQQRQSTRQDFAIGAAALGLGFVVFATLLSLSRGGTVALLLAATVCLGLLYRRQHISGKFFGSLIGAGLLVTLFLFVFGYEAVSQRWEDLESPKRWLIWEANLDALGEFPILGTGIGSQRETHPMYLDMPFFEKEFTHAESSWVQFASETGYVGLGLIALGVMMCLYWCWRGFRASSDLRSTAVLAAITASLIANFVHALVDVVWHVPGCMALVTVLAACACRMHQLMRNSSARSTASPNEVVKTMPRLVWVASLAGVALVSSWMIQTKLPPLLAQPHWHKYVRLTLQSKQRRAESKIAPTPQEIDAEVRAKVAALTAATKANPADGRIQLRLAKEYLSLFGVLQQSSENAITLSQIRDAAMASGFDSPEALESWLKRAIGPNRQLLATAQKLTQRSLLFCPLQGSGYLFLQDLCFLQLGDQEAMQTFLEQATIVRPYEADVLVAAGRAAWSRGENEMALDYWRRAFHHDRYYQRLLIDMLVEYVPANFFFKEFQPDWEALRYLKDRYGELQRPNEYAVVLRQFAQASVERAQQLKGADAIGRWVSAKRTYDELEEPEKGLKCMQLAMKSYPTSYRIRYMLARSHFRLGQFAEAAEHLKWCANRQPNNRELRALLERATKQRFASPTPESLAGNPPKKVSR